MSMLRNCCCVIDCVAMWERVNDPRTFEFDPLTLAMTQNPAREVLGSDFTVHIDGYPAGPRPLAGGPLNFGIGASMGTGFFRANSNAVRMHWLLEWPDIQTHTVSTDHIPETPQTIVPPSITVAFNEGDQTPCRVTRQAKREFFNFNYVGDYRLNDNVWDDFPHLINGGTWGDSEWEISGTPTKASELKTEPDAPLWTFDKVPVRPYHAANNYLVGVEFDSRVVVELEYEGVHPILGVLKRNAWWFLDTNAAIGPLPIKLIDFPLDQAIRSDTMAALQTAVLDEPSPNSGFYQFTKLYPGETDWAFGGGRLHGPPVTLPDVYEFAPGKTYLSGDDDVVIAILDDVPLTPAPDGQNLNNGAHMQGGIQDRPSAFAPIPYSYCDPVVGRAEQFATKYVVTSQFEDGVLSVEGEVPKTFSKSTFFTTVKTKFKRPDVAEWSANDYGLGQYSIARVLPGAIWPPWADDAIGLMPPHDPKPPAAGHRDYIHGFDAYSAWYVVDAAVPPNIIAGPSTDKAAMIAASVAFHGATNSYFYIGEDNVSYFHNLATTFETTLNLNDEEKSAYCRLQFIKGDRTVDKTETAPTAPTTYSDFQKFAPYVGDNWWGGQYNHWLKGTVVSRCALPTFFGEVEVDVRFTHGTTINGTYDYGDEQHLNWYGLTALPSSDEPRWESAEYSRGQMRSPGSLDVDLSLLDPPATVITPNMVLLTSEGAGTTNWLAASWFELVHQNILDNYDEIYEGNTTAEHLYTPETITAES